MERSNGSQRDLVRSLFWLHGSVHTTSITHIVSAVHIVGLAWDSVTRVQAGSIAHLQQNEQSHEQYLRACMCVCEHMYLSAPSTNEPRLRTNWETEEIVNRFIVN